MPRVRFTDEAGRYRVAGTTYEPGDEGDVSDGLAEHLVEDVGRFEYVEEETSQEAESGDESDAEPDPTEESDPGEEAQDESAEATDDGESDEAMGYEERTALAEGLANEHWSSAVSAIEDGEADDVLDELVRIDDRNSVQSAIEERRAELEG